MSIRPTTIDRTGERPCLPDFHIVAKRLAEGREPNFTKRMAEGRVPSLTERVARALAIFCKGFCQGFHNGLRKKLAQ